MKKLILMRHAKSSWNNPSQTDFDRPLNDRGIRDLEKISETVMKQNIVPDLIISSPALRTKITAEKMASVFDVSIEYNKHLYHAFDTEVLDEIKQFDDALECIMLVIHNPGITDVRNYFLEEMIANVPTSGCIAIEFEEATSWNDLKEGKELYFEYPKLYFPKK
ncbi:histidine phosphatase family protein [Flammeovirga yaeyamensis]|uniref:Histidine phosphatase family protein n=1 Tax=Flammeovirga yaeyamensis TaxID=367791 RepID=A0AAX1NAP7_9BACT|nr:histidine phosphatase family protein [Flammeovirga yaeyamensis]MBB3699087.1 phosphohistidine phosphatase [Flammeovirga yaeyamensis]NMF36521.1 histidine phosphatase family protein [Flammeovirga yaeyamensis]QWG03521.1 histidine phosphatase family protein [Flammeovirga yaeyamensis]